MPERKPSYEEFEEEDRSREFGERGRRRDDETGGSGRLRLASRGNRLVAKIVDGLLAFAAALPGLILVIVGGAIAGNRNSSAVGAVLMIVGWLLALAGVLGVYIYQVMLLVKQGQTIGKRTMKVRIVNYENDAQPDLVHVWLLRDLVPILISGVPCIGGIFALADVLFIFGEEQRCLHDQIASTKVVEA